MTLNALFDYVQKRRIATRAPDWLDAIAESNERFADELAEEEERRVAQTQAQLRVGPKKWQVFYLRVYEDRTGDEVAKQLGLALGTVYNYFSEVSRTLAEEMKKLAAASDG